MPAWCWAWVIYHSEPVGTRGYLDQLTGEREVGAATAACIAIKRRKFEAVVGFDAVNLPIELNDIDLCLRLFERGFAHVLTSYARLIHYESASRSFKTNGYTVYAKDVPILTSGGRGYSRRSVFSPGAVAVLSASRAWIIKRSTYSCSGNGVSLTMRQNAHKITTSCSMKFSICRA